MANNHENDLLRRTKTFALTIIRLFAALPSTPQAQVFGKQVLRSGTSPGAQYREAFRSRSRAEFISKVDSCLQELEETGYWLELLVESGIVSQPAISDLDKECRELIAIFASISIKAKKQNTA